MTTDDFFVRLKGNLPKTWFPKPSPYTDAVLYGVATILNNFYGIYVFAKSQLRLLTMTGGWLDVFAGDFFGDSLPRKANETDVSYRLRIQINLFRERNTRAAVIDVLKEITGKEPVIFEPGRPADTGSYRSGGCGYGLAGGYGSLVLRNQAFVTAFRPAGSNIGNIAGYGSPVGAYDTASQIEYIDPSIVNSGANDADIYDAINRVRPAGTMLWTQIK